MAKDSDKNRVLERRRVELTHAIRHGCDMKTIAKRIDALKKAVFAVSKKHHVRYTPFTKFVDNDEWQAVDAFWGTLPSEDVISIVNRWTERPSYKEIFLACQNNIQTPTLEARVDV